MARKGKGKKRDAASASASASAPGGSGPAASKRARASRDWDALSWQAVPAPDSRVLSAGDDAQGGFLSLEVIDASEADGFVSLVGASAPVETATGLRAAGGATAAAGRAKGAAGAAAKAEGQRGGEGGAGAPTGKKKKKKKLRGPRNKDKARAKAEAAEAAAAACGAAGGTSGDGGATGAAGALESLSGTLWADYGLHVSVERAVCALGFARPTPIQEQCVPAGARGRCDLIGAAETGSGKTLAFGLPILHRLMEERDLAAARGAEAETRLQALVVCPTRELALQVKDHLAAAARECQGVRVVPIVGGMAPQKQARLLKGRPEVVVATPGRLWELMSQAAEAGAHLQDLSGLRFFVLDEADRMVEHGHFKELESIIERLPKHAGQEVEADAEVAEARHEAKRRRRMQRGERVGNARGSLGAPIRETKGVESEEEDGSDEGDEAAPEIDGDDDADDAAVANDDDAALADASGTADAAAATSRGPIRQTFVFSATLSVPPSIAARLGRRAPATSRKQAGPLEQLMAKVSFAKTPKLVDLTRSRLVAATLLEAAMDVEEDDRDSALYCLLRAHPGRCMVFTSTIAAARRCAALLVTLGVRAQALHAGMQQRQRLKALDRFKADGDSEREAHVLVATDVAARGLDIPGVRLVVHYQLPQSTDTYVHRAGRTGRAGRDGASVVLVGPKERGKYVSLCRALGREGVMDNMPIEAEEMQFAGKAVRLAVKIDSKERASRRERAEDSWARRTAEAAGLELDEDALAGHEREESHAEEGRRARRAAAEAKALRAQLDALLATPTASMPRSHVAREAGGLASRWKVGGQGQLVQDDTREEAVATLRRAKHAGAADKEDNE